jgi:hypothetical protein
MAPSLDRPVTSLAEHVQTAMGSFFTIQQKLILNKKVPVEFLDKFKEEKQLFKSQCENMQQVLQSYYRHATDYATFSQRAVDDRMPSGRRCLSSAETVHRETQELCRTFQMIMTSLNHRRSDLSRYLNFSNGKFPVVIYNTFIDSQFSSKRVSPSHRTTPTGRPKWLTSTVFSC